MDRAFRYAAWLITGTVVLSFAYVVWLNRDGYFAYDSWTYYELSNTIARDFFRQTSWRSFWSTSAYSTSFPPLWPVLIHLWNALFSQGIHGAVWLATISLLLFSALSEWAGRRLFSLPWVGFSAFALTLMDVRLVNEVVAGKSIPLHLVFLALILGLLLPGRAITPARAAQIGAVAGLALLNRFDFLLVAVGIGMGLAWTTRRWQVMVAYLASLLIFVSPWITYSLIRHGTMFASDNSLVALATRNIQFSDFYPTSPPTLFNAPDQWLLKVFANFVWFCRDWVVTPKPLVALIGLAVAITAWLWKSGRLREADWRRPAIPLEILGFALALQCASYIATGYIDGRYFAAHRWLLGFAAVGIVASAARPYFSQATVAILAATAALGTAGLWRHNPYVIPGETTGILAEAHDIAACRSLTPRHTVLFADHWKVASAFGATYGIGATSLPPNYGKLDASTRALFLRRFGITHIVAAQPRNYLGEDLGTVRVPGCEGLPLWQITGL